LPPAEGAQSTKPSVAEGEQKQLLKRVKQVLRERVDEVRIGDRLRQSAACLVLGENDLGYQMRELLAAAGHEAPKIVPSLELNLKHALVRRLDHETDPARFERLALLLFEQAVLAEGRQLEDPAAFVTRLNELLAELDRTP
jgi:molecular chaperone HtpG